MQNIADNVVRRLSALLALAADAQGTPEGANAHAKAQAYAQKHGVDLGSFRPSTLDEQGRPVGERYEPTNARDQWRSVLVGQIARYYNVEVVINRVRGGSSAWTLVGTPSDIAATKALYARAASEIEQESVEFVARAKVNTEPWACGCGWEGQIPSVAYVPQKGLQRSCPECGGNVARKPKRAVSARSDGDTFRKHAAMGFGARLAAAKAEAEASENGRVTASLVGQGTALVLAGRAQAALAKRDEIFPSLRKGGKVRTNGSTEASRQGYAFGRSMGVHKGNIG